MRRIIQRETTTIKIVSVKLTWAEEAEPVEAQSVAARLPAQVDVPRPLANASRPKKMYPKIKTTK